MDSKKRVPVEEHCDLAGQLANSMAGLLGALVVSADNDERCLADLLILRQVVRLKAILEGGAVDRV